MSDTVRASESAQNARYLAAALRDCVLRGEAPFASHGLYTLDGVLRDEVPAERELGIAAGFAWREVAHVTAFYTDLGRSRGMELAEEHAARLHTKHLGMGRSTAESHRIQYRILGPDWDRK